MEILVKTCLMPLALKTQNDSFAFVHELKQEMHADLKYIESLEDELDELESDRAEFQHSKTVPSSKGRLNLLHMDLCGPMRVASINGKKYILVIVDDYSRYTWTLFLRSKDETPEVLKDFLTMIQRNLQAPVIYVRTDKGTEFLNKTLNAFFKEEGIEHQPSTPRTPEQNGVVERRNRTLIEAARTILSASKLPLFFWAEAIATACYNQNRSIIIPTHEKMAYHIINDRKPSIKHLHIFGCTCYLTRDGENLDKMKEKRDPCIFVGYSTQSKGYRVYNKRTRLIVESIHLRFDEIKDMSEMSVANDTSGLVPQRQKASDYDNPDPAPELQNVSPSADTTVPSQQELDLLFGPLYDEFFNDGTSRVNKSSSPTDNSTLQHTHPSTNIHPTSEPSTTTNIHAEEKNDNQAEFTNPFCTPVQENAESSSRNIGNSNVHTFNQPQDSEYRWTKDHPLTQVRGNPSKPVQTRRQLATDPEMFARLEAVRIFVICCTSSLFQFISGREMAFLNGKSIWIENGNKAPRRPGMMKLSKIPDFKVLLKYQSKIRLNIHLKELKDLFDTFRRLPDHCRCLNAVKALLGEFSFIAFRRKVSVISSGRYWYEMFDSADWRIPKWDGDASSSMKSDSIPHAHAQTTKTFYKHQDSRIMKAQELKTKTSVTNSDMNKILP
ncbi:retrovirus-related pol polyprotein from transposon TNT 1-94 [Tanacetum coccineum]